MMGAGSADFFQRKGAKNAKSHKEFPRLALDDRIRSGIFFSAFLCDFALKLFRFPLSAFRVNFHVD